MSDALPPTALERALATVIDPELRRPMLELGMLKDLHVEGDAAFIRVVLTTPACPLKDTIRGSIEGAVIGTVPDIATAERCKEFGEMREILLRLRIEPALDRVVRERREEGGERSRLLVFAYGRKR
jgi:metal-sulfur cluster biosynthetic enzyme